MKIQDIKYWTNEDKRAALNYLLEWSKEELRKSWMAANLDFEAILGYVKANNSLGALKVIRADNPGMTLMAARAILEDYKAQGREFIQYMRKHNWEIWDDEEMNKVIKFFGRNAVVEVFFHQGVENFCASTVYGETSRIESERGWARLGMSVYRDNRPMYSTIF